MPQLNLFASPAEGAPPAPPAPPPAPCPEPPLSAQTPVPGQLTLPPLVLPPPPPLPTYSPRPVGLEAADWAAWAALQAQVEWAALLRSRSLGVYAPELGLALVVAERRLVAAGLTAAEVRARAGARQRVPGREGADPWPLVAVLTAASAPTTGATASGPTGEP